MPSLGCSGFEVVTNKHSVPFLDDNSAMSICDFWGPRLRQPASTSVGYLRIYGRVAA